MAFPLTSIDNESIRFVHRARSMAIVAADFGKAPNLLISVVAVEMVVNVALLAFLPIFWRVVWTSVVIHRNFRLQICTAALYYSLGLFGRFFVFYVEYTDLPDEDIAYLYIPANLMRTSAHVFTVTLISCFALERLVATRLWSWYEKGSLPTTLIFLATQAFNFFTYYINNVLRDEYSLNLCYAHMMIIGITGLLGFRYVYVVNLKLYKDVQTAAHIDRYSVSRTFQIKENVEAVKYMYWLARGWIVFTLLSFLTYGFFAFGPHDYEILRPLSHTVFDLLITLYIASFYYLSITGNSHIHKKFKKFKCLRILLRRLGLQSKRNETITVVRRTEADNYFTQLYISWK